MKFEVPISQYLHPRHSSLSQPPTAKFCFRLRASTSTSSFIIIQLNQIDMRDLHKKENVFRRSVLHDDGPFQGNTAHFNVIGIKTNPTLILQLLADLQVPFLSGMEDMGEIRTMFSAEAIIYSAWL